MRKFGILFLLSVMVVDFMTAGGVRFEVVPCGKPGWQEVSKEKLDKYSALQESIQAVKKTDGKCCMEDRTVYWRMTSPSGDMACENEISKQNKSGTNFEIRHTDYSSFERNTIAIIFPAISTACWWCGHDKNENDRPCLSICDNDLLMAKKLLVCLDGHSFVHCVDLATSKEKIFGVMRTVGGKQTRLVNEADGFLASMRKLVSNRYFLSGVLFTVIGICIFHKKFLRLCLYLSEKI
jgi:hypothetical protein